MEKTQRLETFLGMAKDRNYNAVAKSVKFLIEETRDGETNELEDVELVANGDTFYCTDLIGLAEALELDCYIAISSEGKLYVCIH